MNTTLWIVAVAAVASFSSEPTLGQTRSQIPPEITTPDRVPTRLGTLQFRDGMPDAKTTDSVYDELDYLHAVNAFVNAFQGVSQYAIRKGFIDAGVNDNDVLIFSGLMDSKSLFLTANADTVYFWTYIDLSKGPLVFESVPGALGVIDDMWWRWVTDFGLPGADRAEGARYLLVPPGYNGLLPDGGYFVHRSATLRVGVLGRSFLENNDPAPPVALIKKTLKIYPYKPGTYGTSIGDFLTGKSTLGELGDPPPMKFVEGTGKVMNTVPPNDFSFYEMLHALVQQEPAEALDPEIAGQFAAIGIVKGKPFNPDARMRKILTEAVAMGNAASRVVGFRPRLAEGFRYYGESSWWTNPLFISGYEFRTPPPMITKEGVKPFPDTGARTLHARTAFFYVATGVTPAMSMRLTNIGSQYLVSNFDASGSPFDGAKTYKLRLPPKIPHNRFWSLTLYDNQTRSMLQTDQRFPRAGSQTFPTPAAVASADGSTTLYFGPSRPQGVAEGNWIQTVPGKGWFTILRLYSPLQPFFDKTWRIGEIEEVR